MWIIYWINRPIWEDSNKKCQKDQNFFRISFKYDLILFDNFLFRLIINQY